MALRVGQVLRGLKGNYELLQPLKGSTVFKARVLSSPTIQAEWAMVKTAATEHEQISLKREHHNYKLDKIATSPFIRTLYDTVQLEQNADDQSCLVFEWMDHGLNSVPAWEFRSHPTLPRVVSKTVLSALDTLKTLNATHTDINPNNIFVSDIESKTPVAKLGDLGSMIPSGFSKVRLQCLECRAPEVWQGLACRHASDIWSLAVTLTHKLSILRLFGPGGNPLNAHTEAWCIAKLMRFVGPMPHPVNPKAYKDEFELAERFQIVNRPQSSLKLLTRRHWRTELEAIPDPPVPQDLLDFIESLLIIDPEKRPTAAEALLHPFFDFDESSVNSSAVQLPSAEVVQEKDSSTHTLDGQEITVDGIGFRISSSS